MNKVLVLIMLTCGICLSAHADIWKWVDEKGDFFNDTATTEIYTWLDEFGKRHYADTPGHESAVSVELVWHSEGNLADLQQGGGDRGTQGGSSEAIPGETPEERFEREQAEAYYCKRATEIYESYLNAPRLYETREDGTRHYLSKEEAETTLSETKAQVDEVCRSS
jgi:hypothetical protein